MKETARIGFRSWKFALALSSCLWLALPVPAATNYVVTTNDFGMGSLREAILNGNAVGQATILFSNVSGTIALSSNLPPITGSLTIRGPGTNVLSISGSGSNRIFVFGARNSNFVSGLTLTRGRGATNELGGAIVNEGTLTILRCLMVSNVAENGAGGAIFNAGDLRLIASTITDNHVAVPVVDQFDPSQLGRSGDNGYGGGIYQTTGSVTLINCVLARNQASGALGYYGFYPGPLPGDGGLAYGGALYVERGSALISNCVLYANKAGGGDGPFHGGTAFGGAITLNSGTVELQNSIVSSNSASAGRSGGTPNQGAAGGNALGGAIFVRQGTLTVSSSSINSNAVVASAGTSNTRGGGPGGIATGGGIAIIAGNTVMRNSALFANTVHGGQGPGSFCATPWAPLPAQEGGGAAGGGLYVQDAAATLQLIGCTISSNIVAGGAGGRFVCGTNDYFVASGIGRGGGILSSSMVSVISCTIAGNSVLTNSRPGSSGGGIFASIDVVTKSSLIAGNAASVSPDCAARIISLGHNLVQQTNGSSGWITSDILTFDPRLGPLQDNGGLTWTHALLADSPAIDAGSSGLATTDQRGEPRVVDTPALANAAGGDGSDIGALEVDHNLRCTGVQRIGSNILVRFTSVSDRQYGMRTKFNLTDAWLTLPAIIRGSGGIVTMTNFGSADRLMRFYQPFTE